MTGPPSDDDAKTERLQKLLARAGVASRRSSEELIRQGRVAVNREVVTKLGTKVGPEDSVTVDGKPVVAQETKLYFMVNKPRGYVTTVTDPYGRPTVLHLVEATQRIYPIGRLDVESEGLLLLTNDGDLAYKLAHPRFALEKEYIVLVNGDPTDEELKMLREGVVLDGERTAPAQAEKVRREEPGTWLRIVIHEGRKRQIRRMVEAIGFRVLRLKRVRVGPLEMGSLPSGSFRHLTGEEALELQRAV